MESKTNNTEVPSQLTYFGNNKAKEFFSMLFPNINESKQFIEIRIINTEGKVEQCFFNDINEAIKYIDKEWETLKKQNVYFGVCPRSCKKGDKSSVSIIYCLWVDIDFKDISQKEADKLLSDFSPYPNVVVSSGHGYHVYWIINPFDIESVENVNYAEGILKGIAQELHGDIGSAEIARVLRVPGTFNNKDIDNPKKVDIIKYYEDDSDI